MRARRGKATTKSGRADIKRAVDYVRNQHAHGRMNYPEAFVRHYPIGNGVTDTAAKTVVGTRMKRAGARFSQHITQQSDAQQVTGRRPFLGFTDDLTEPLKRKLRRVLEANGLGSARDPGAPAAVRVNGKIVNARKLAPPLKRARWIIGPVLRRLVTEPSPTLDR